MVSWCCHLNQHIGGPGCMIVGNVTIIHIIRMQGVVGIAGVVRMTEVIRIIGVIRIIIVRITPQKGIFQGENNDLPWIQKRLKLGVSHHSLPHNTVSGLNVFSYHLCQSSLSKDVENAFHNGGTTHLACLSLNVQLDRIVTILGFSIFENSTLAC